MPPAKQRAPPALPDEIIEKILLHVPPDDPATLVRAALATRRWCRLVADPAFRRRRFVLHRATPPMLGFMCDANWSGKQTSTCFVPTSSCRPRRAVHRGLLSFDARHGRVLLQVERSNSDLVVWDPITDQRVELPRPPWYQGYGRMSMKSTVLCAATGSCDHVNCHRGPFIVVLVGTEDDIIALDDDAMVSSEDEDIFHDGEGWCQRVPKDMFSCIYSSESGSWSERTHTVHPDDKVAGHAVPSWATHSSSYYVDMTESLEFVQTELTTLEDGRLGIARVEQSTELCLWSRDEGNHVEEWTLCKVIDLKDLFPHVDSLHLKYCLVGFAESVCVAFVSVEGGTFTIDMKSGLMKKVYQGRSICCAVPYINFCTPALEAQSTDDDEQSAGISSGKGRVKRLKS